MNAESTGSLIAVLRQAVIDGQAKEAAAATERALAAGLPPRALVDEALIPAMDEAGRLFECGEFFVPELLVAARALKASQALITPLLAGSPTAAAGRIAIGTVKGDMHDIGKNLVVALLQGGGFEVIDLGADVPPERFVAAVAVDGADIVGLSALLTTTMLQMKATVQALERAGVRGSAKVIVGGAPVTQRFADEIGADGFADNAAAAVALARRLMGRHRMTSRERVLTAMRRRQPDRPPFDLSFGFSTAQIETFRARTGADDPYDYFEVDTRMVWPGATRLATDFSGYLGPLPPGTVVDEWGLAHVPTSSAEGDHAHLEGYRHPMLRLESEADAAGYPLPDIDAAYRYEPVREEIEDIHRRNLAAMAMLECTVFERAWYLRSMERLLLDFTDGNAFATTLLDRITERRIAQAQHYARCGADVIAYGDDVGTQRGMLMSVRMWRTWLKPRLARTIAAARDVRTGRPRLLPQRRRRLGHHPGPHRDWRRHPQPDPARVHGPGGAQAGVRGTAVVLGHHRHAVDLPLRQPRRRAARGALAHRDGGRRGRAVPGAHARDRARSPVREHRRLRRHGERRRQVTLADPATYA